MSEPTLDAVALLVLQLEPEDCTELGRVREQLADLVFGDHVAIAAEPLVVGALQALTLLVDGTADDPAAALSAVGRLLQRALDVAPPRAMPAAVPALARPAHGDASRSADLGLDLLAEFFAESRECLGGAEVVRLALEQARGGKSV